MAFNIIRPLFPRGEQTSFFTSGRNSAVECQLPKLDVVGSSPIARSNKNNGLREKHVAHFYFFSHV